MNRERIPFLVPSLGPEEAASAQACLNDNWISTAGPYPSYFENALAQRFDISPEHVLVTDSGTSALHLALKVSGVLPNDLVVLPSFTFAATANAVFYLGAAPLFLDVDKAYWQLDPIELERFFTDDCHREAQSLKHGASGRPVRAVVAVHALGNPAPISKLKAVTDRFGVALIEDAAAAVGTLYEGLPVGHFGTAGALSFNGNKIVTSGGGGALFTRYREGAASARLLARQGRVPGAEYHYQEIGFNYKMTSLAAAVGLAQLKKLDSFLELKRQIHHRYATEMERWKGVSVYSQAPWGTSNHWVTAITFAELPTLNKPLHHALAEENIETGFPWLPLHLSAPHQGEASPPCPNSEFAYRHSLLLPSSVNLTESDQSRVLETLNRLLRR